MSRMLYCVLLDARLLNTQRERILTIERAQARMHRNVQSVSGIIIRCDNNIMMRKRMVMVMIIRI